MRHSPSRPLPAVVARFACAIVACAIVACALAACADGPAAPSARSALHATWEAPTLALQPRGTLRATLALRPDGRFSWQNVSYGVYAGDAATKTSAWTRSEGTYVIRGDSLAFRVDSITTWDSFHGGREPTVQKPYPYGGLFDDCRFTVQGDALVLSFTTYPLDAPEPAVAIYSRRSLPIFD